MIKTNYVELRIALRDALAAMETHIEALGGRLMEEGGYPLWVDGIEDPNLARREVVRCLTGITYRDDQDPHEVERCTALVGTTDQTLALAREVNRDKQALARALRNMDGLKVDVTDPDLHAVRREPLIKAALRALGRERLHRRQATRQVECLDVAPDSVTFIWSRSRKVEQRSLQQVLAALQKRMEHARTFKPGYVAYCEDDIRRIERLIENDPLERLAEVDPAHTHPRANVVWIDGDGAMTRRQRRAMTPQFYPARAGEKLPRLRPLPAALPPKGHQLERRDKTVEDTPLLSAMSIHRYREGYRYFDEARKGFGMP